MSVSLLLSLMSPQLCILVAVLLWFTISTTLLIGSLFFSIYIDSSSLYHILILSQYNLLKIRIDILKNCLVFWFSCVQYQHLILTTFIVCRSVILLILIILAWPYFDFKLMWSVLLLLTFFLLMPNLVCFFECQLSRQKKLSLQEIPTS